MKSITLIQIPRSSYCTFMTIYGRNRPILNKCYNCSLCFFFTWKCAKKEKKEQIIDLIRSLPFIKLHLIGLLASDDSFIIYESRFFFSQFRISSLFKLESDSLKIQINECQIPTGKTLQWMISGWTSCLTP